jgi:small subunit ribosomal protein S20
LPQHKSATKKVKTDKKRNARNKMIRSGLRTEIKKLRTLMNEKKTENLQAQLKTTVKIIDKTKTKGVIHRNVAARLKSRLTRHTNELLANT